jgi:hypothetical protein
MSEYIAIKTAIEIISIVVTIGISIVSNHYLGDAAMSARGAQLVYVPRFSLARRFLIYQLHRITLFANWNIPPVPPSTWRFIP